MTYNITLKGNKVEEIRDGYRKEITCNYRYGDILRVVKSLDYAGNGLIRDNNVEYMSGLPRLADMFYKCVVERRFPTAEAFFENVLNSHFIVSERRKTVCLKGQSREYSYEALRGRVFRMYPSLLRDFLFFILCSQSGEFDEVEYSLQIDWDYGYDLLITYQGQRFGIALFTNTQRGHEFRSCKGDRRAERLQDVIELSLAINPLSKEKQVGVYALYDETDIKTLKNMMDEALQKTIA